jgi:hypothetical protein
MSTYHFIKSKLNGKVIDKIKRVYSPRMFWRLKVSGSARLY